MHASMKSGASVKALPEPMPGTHETITTAAAVISTDLLEAAGRSEGPTGTWGDEERLRAITRYRQFLLLVAEDPARPVAPTRDIDEIWHLHMLSPIAYHRDCEALFGRLLDHDGGFGKGEGELGRLIEVFEDTERRWQALFGEPYRTEAAEDVTSCWHDCSGRCWHACSNVERISAS